MSKRSHEAAVRGPLARRRRREDNDSEYVRLMAQRNALVHREVSGAPLSRQEACRLAKLREHLAIVEAARREAAR